MARMAFSKAGTAKDAAAHKSLAGVLKTSGGKSDLFSASPLACWSAIAEN